MINLTRHQKADVVAEVLLQSYWSVNEDHIREWINEWIDSNLDGDFPTFDMFAEEFSFDPGYEKPSLSVVLNELLQFIDLGGYPVTDQLISGFESAFESLLDHIMTEREEERLEAQEWKREWREVAV